MVTSLGRDLRTAWRGLVKVPGLATAAVISLALGIGANLTALGLLRAIEFPVVPYPDARRLVQIDASNEAKQARGFPLSLPDYQDVRARAFVFRDIGVSTDDVMTLEDGAEPVRLGIMVASPSYFTTLGVAAEVGRPFSSADSAGNLVVLSHRVWVERYGSDRGAVGRALRLDGRPFTVVGVMPSRFDENVEAWIPLGAGSVATRDDRRYTVVARLRSEIPLDQARVELQSLARALETENPATNRGWTMSPTPLQRLRSRESGGGYYQLQAAVAVLLLAACANIANLLLARSVSRRRELAVRSALGASRGQLVRVILLEGVLLALGGAALGLVLAAWGVSGAAILGDFPASIHVPFDALTILAAVGLSLVSGLLVGFLPAIDVLRFDVSRLVRAGSARATDSRRQLRLRGLLVAAEVACALVLVIGASLMARSLWNRQQRELGFEPRGAVKGTLSIADSAGAPRMTRVREIVQRIGGTLGATPGVQTVGFVGYPIPTRLGAPIPLRLASSVDDPLGSDVPRVVQSVTPDYFAAMGTRMRAGRAFSAADRAGGVRVAIVNEELARRVWAARDPIGQEISLGTGSAEWQSTTVVGVVGNTLRSAMHDRVLPAVYVSFDQFPVGDVTVVARSAGSAAPLVTALRRAVFEVDRRLVVDDVQTLESDWAAFMRPTRLYATLLAVFAALALALAAIGVFASMAYSTTQRTRELGIRLALGADGRALVVLVLGQGLRLATAGIILGVGASLAATRVLRGLLYGVNAIDPLTVVGTAALLLAVAMAACWIPARRTTALNPASVLRAD